MTILYTVGVVSLLYPINVVPLSDQGVESLCSFVFLCCSKDIDELHECVYCMYYACVCKFGEWLCVETQQLPI